MKRLVVFLFLLSIILFFYCGINFSAPYSFPQLFYFPKMPVATSNPITVEGSQLGRFLFYDPILSADSTFACSSCHKQKFAFSNSPNQFSKGVKGIKTKRNTMALFNLAWYPAMFWDGKAESVEAQVVHPIVAKDEMNMNFNEAVNRINKNKFYTKKFKKVFGKTKVDSAEIVNAIGQFLRTLISHESKYDKVLQKKSQFSKDEFEGFQIMNSQDKGACMHCHTTDSDALGTTLKFSNNGLDEVKNLNDFSDKGRGIISGNEKDNGKFMIPSLRNIVLTAPYMHDGRFSTLEEVVEFYSSGVKISPTIDSKMVYANRGGARFSKEEQRKIICFLKTLTDSVFISSSEFSNPFEKK